MKTLYVTSLQTFSGKTAVCAALGERLQRDGYRVGYFKPLSTQPWEPVPGRALDEDADFVRRTLNLAEEGNQLIGITLTPSLLQETLCGCAPVDFLHRVQTAYQSIAADKDVLLLEGGAALHEGTSIGLGAQIVANALDAPILAIVRFRNEMSLVDDCLLARSQLGDRLLGMLINGVPARAWSFVSETCRSCLENQNVSVLGVLPSREELQTISVGEIAQVLEAEFLCLPDKRDLLIQHLMVGAMSAEQALPRMRRIVGSKAVITGGDRADIQLIALETATACLILTGHLRPQPEVLRRAEETGVPVLLVRQNTMQTIEAIEKVFGKTRLGQREKLERFEALFEEYFDLAKLYRKLGLGSSMG